MLASQLARGRLLGSVLIYEWQCKRAAPIQRAGRWSARPAAFRTRRNLLEGNRLGLLYSHFYFLRVHFASFLAEHRGVNFPSPDYVRVVQTQIFFTNLYRLQIEGLGLGVLFLTIVE